MGSRPPSLLGVDIGGTKIATAVTTFQGQILGQILIAVGHAAPAVSVAAWR